MLIDRRTALLSGLSGAAALSFPRSALAADAGGRILVVFLLRGGLDGLAAVAPVGDPTYVTARRGLAQPAGMGRRLDSTFELHPKLTTFADLYAARELLVLHAIGSPYQNRSHFDAQNVLDTGASAPFARPTGWINAALDALPARAAAGRKELGLALSPQAPLALRGDAPVASWSPTPIPGADADTIARLMDLYGRTEPRLASALAAAQAANAVAAEAGADVRGRGAPALAKTAAGFLTRRNGPVAAMIEVTGWDTHVGHTQPNGPLARALGELDAAMAALRSGLGPAWANTLVVVMTEFGRTVAMNGSGGTDHGVGMAGFLAGGAVAGGRVLADWPGLGPSALLDGRDLRPTRDLRGVLKGALGDHFGISRAALEAEIFPDSATVPPVSGLLRT
jgi:uncharacterized protein (DUF1501 family)